MHSGDHCCHCDLYYLYHFDDSMMEVKQTYADVMMNDFDFRGNLVNRYDAHGHDRVQLIDCGGATMVMAALPNGDDVSHVDCSDLAAMHVVFAAIVSAIDAEHFFSMQASHNRDRLVRNHLWCRVRV